MAILMDQVAASDVNGVRKGGKKKTVGGGNDGGDRRSTLKEKRVYRTRLPVPAYGWFCTGGKPIDGARIRKWDPLIYKLITKFLPQKRLAGAGWDFNDLVLEARLEVFMALVDGLDWWKAIFISTKTDPKERAAHLAEKLANPEKTYEHAEFHAVNRRLSDWLRRDRHAFHPDQMGGRAVSYDMVLAKMEAVDPTRSIFLEGDDEETRAVPIQTRFLVDDVEEEDTATLHGLIDDLLVKLAEGQDVRSQYATLPEEHQEAVRRYLFKQSVDVIDCPVDDDEAGSIFESPKEEESASLPCPETEEA